VNLEKFRLAFADVDNTLLSLHMYNNNGVNDKDNGKRIVGVREYEDWLKYNICNNAYIHCKAPKPMHRLLTRLHTTGSKIYGLTECSNSFEYNAKYNRLRECYDGIFTNHGDLISVDSRSKKVLVMKIIAEREGVPLDQVFFVDDSYFEVMEAADAGIFAIHTTEAMEIF